MTSGIRIRWQLVAAAGSIIEIEGTLDIFIYLISQFFIKSNSAAIFKFFDPYKDFTYAEEWDVAAPNQENERNFVA